MAEEQGHDPCRDPKIGDVVKGRKCERMVTFVGLPPFNATNGVIEVRYTQVRGEKIRRGWCFLRAWRAWCRKNAIEVCPMPQRMGDRLAVSPTGREPCVNSKT